MTSATNLTTGTGKAYWRSLDELADTPEFRQFAKTEFPGFANVYDSLGEAEVVDENPEEAAVSRRRFLALSAAALGMAGLAGCRRPDIEILPYSAVPDDQVGHVVPGKPAFYATSIPRAGGGFPVLVESHAGRPTKVEGNPIHPLSGGGTDVFAQASVLDMYSPDRVMNEAFPGVMNGKKSPRKWEDFDAVAIAEAARLLAAQGDKFAVLAEGIPSPAVRLIRAHINAKLPKAKWFGFDAVDNSEVAEGAQLAFGAKLVPFYKFDKADRVLALDSDFLGTDPNQVAYSRAFASRRTLRKADSVEKMNRLYVVESAYTVTGSAADHRLRLPASQIGGFLVAVGKELVASGKLKKPAPPQLGTTPVTAGLNEKWVKGVAKDLADKAGAGLIVVGPRQPAWVHALAHALNDGLGNYEACCEFRDPPTETTADKPIAELVKDMAGGKVDTLLIIGGNPVFNAPADLKFADELQKVAKKIRLGLYHDQTSEACDWHLPLAHDLEGWGDTEAADGTLLCVQPLIAPLNGAAPAGIQPARGGRTVLEVLTLLTQYAIADGDPKTNPPTTNYIIAKAKAYELVRRAFADRSGVATTAKEFDAAFNAYKQRGFLPPDQDKGIRKPKPAAVNAGTIGSAMGTAPAVAAPTKEAMEITFHPDYSVLDGRFAMNPWMQEFPDPITKLVWDNAAVVSPKTAAEFKVKQSDIVKLTVAGLSVEIPVFILPGQADYTVAVAFGQYGKMMIGRVDKGGGTDVFPVRKSTGMHTAAGVKFEPTGRRGDLVTTQEHGVIPEGREIIVEKTAEKYKGELKAHGHAGHDHAGEHGSTEHPQKIGFPPDGHLDEEDYKKGFQGGFGNPQQFPAPVREKQERFPLDLARPELLDSQFQWGMVIDLTTCTGCSACVVACQSENNIPVVGKTDVKRNREMHWIRIDRYFTTAKENGATEEEPQIAHQPLACQHCEQAPCEQVCPVNAAVHSPDGLNLQVYNRCIGTRYCANGCPYKVRRFNWFDFNKRHIDQLRVATPFSDGGMSFTNNLVPETLKMQKNPDVTVRMRGVMEKCTYCVQRIERGKYGAKIAAAEVAQGRVAVPTDDAFKPSDGSTSAYRKPKDAATAKAAGYDLDARGRVIVPDGLIVTACQNACPSAAITFGNVLDPNSKVAKIQKLDSDYLLLGELNTKPRTSFLPRVKNTNADLI